MVDTILTGSSYGLFGIDEDLLSNRQANLSLVSQDLYFSMKGILYACQANPNIQKVVLLCSYYYLFSDLSLAQNEKELMRVSRIYQPLFGDVHNCLLLPPWRGCLPYSQLFDIGPLLEEHSRQVYRKHYFGPHRPRARFATILWGDPSLAWHQLSLPQRLEAAQRRAMAHNRALHRLHSFRHNRALFWQLASFCHDRGIRLTVLCTPLSPEYRRFLDPAFRTPFREALALAPGKPHFLDLSDHGAFGTHDFNDMDHLGDGGATRLTAMLLDFLRAPGP